MIKFIKSTGLEWMGAYLARTEAHEDNHHKRRNGRKFLLEIPTRKETMGVTALKMDGQWRADQRKYSQSR